MSLKWMWNGASGSMTASAARGADANASTSVNAPSLVAHVREVEHRPHEVDLRRDREHVVDRAELAHATHHLDAEGTSRSFASRRERRSPSWSTTSAIACSLPAEQEARVEDDHRRRRPSRSRRCGQSIPRAILNFLPGRRDP
jgi:hypothetical protein